jgi:hypothetical protein
MGFLIYDLVTEEVNLSFFDVNFFGPVYPGSLLVDSSHAYLVYRNEEDAYYARIVKMNHASPSADVECRVVFEPDANIKVIMENPEEDRFILGFGTQTDSSLVQHTVFFNLHKDLTTDINTAKLPSSAITHTVSAYNGGGASILWFVQYNSALEEIEVGKIEFSATTL